MSFILESIKKAERERKLGQQHAPSISIEYTGALVDDMENKKLQWMLLLLGLIVTAIVVWSATYYFTNKDRQYIEELSVSDVSSDAKIDTQTQNSSISRDDDAKRSIAMVPVKNVHKSDLKSVKLIADDDPPVAHPTVKEDKPVEKKESKTPITSIVKNTQPRPKLETTNEIDIVANKISDISDKQELAAIYSDLAAIKEEDKAVSKSRLLADQVAEELVHIKAASYVVPDANALKTNTQKIVTEEVISRPVTPVHQKQHEQAVRSGVPSFGELPYDIQEKIPDFNVSVHMFNADPVQRRIRINGHMYTEGKSLQQDLALVEITRYGAVFDYQGHLFRLNVR
jgi:hypothetical protein